MSCHSGWNCKKKKKKRQPSQKIRHISQTQTHKTRRAGTIPLKYKTSGKLPHSCSNLLAQNVQKVVKLILQTAVIGDPPDMCCQQHICSDGFYYFQ